jgi:lipid-binding SYLF domain-containing protein
MSTMIRLTVVATIMSVLTVGCFIHPAMSGDTTKLDLAVDKTLKKLYAKSPAAAAVSKKAKAVLMFPSVTKVGFLVGGQYGEGALIMEGKTVGYYNTLAGSYGLQAGAQKFGYALFFMDTASLEYLNKSDGWEIGVGPSVVVVDEGMAKTMTSTTVHEGIYAFIFSQQGLMAGLGIQGTKITKINP